LARFIKSQSQNLEKLFEKLLPAGLELLKRKSTKELEIPSLNQKGLTIENRNFE
jgi:hypothetical protein